MKVLVTGGTGFLGSYIVKRLLARGYAVRVLARHRTEMADKMDVEFVQGDILHPENVILACQRVDAVIHTAAREGIEPRRYPFYQTNVLGTKNVIEGCYKAGIKRLVATSSPSVVDAGTSLKGVDETQPYPKKSLSYYAETKRIAEIMVLNENSENLRTCTIRPRLIWGPGDRQLVPRIIERAGKGLLWQIGDGTNFLDITYVENAAEAHILALEALDKNPSVPGNAYFISQGTPVNCWDWLNHILEMVGINPVTKRLSFTSAYCLGYLYEGMYSLFRPGKEPPMTRFLATQLAQSYWFNISKARRDLGYEPRISTEEGTKKLGEWLNRRPPSHFDRF